MLVFGEPQVLWGGRQPVGQHHVMRAEARKLVTVGAVEVLIHSEELGGFNPLLDPEFGQGNAPEGGGQGFILGNAAPGGKERALGRLIEPAPQQNSPLGRPHNQVNGDQRGQPRRDGIPSLV